MRVKRGEEVWGFMVWEGELRMRFTTGVFWWRRRRWR